MSPRISNEIQHYGARLSVAVDSLRPWSAHFTAVLDRRIGKQLIGTGKTPIEAMEDLDTKISNEEP